MTDESSAPAVIEMDAVPPAPVRTLSMVAAEIKTFSGAMLNNAIEIGRRMYEAKYMLPHGQFMSWAKANTGFSQSAVNNFMRLFDAYAPQQGCIFGAGAESGTISGLSMSQALALLALPADERESFAEEVGAESLSVRELENEIAEYKRKQAATQARLEAEQNRAAELQSKLDGVSTQNEIRLVEVRNEERRKAEEAVAFEMTITQDNLKRVQEQAEKLRTALSNAKTEISLAESKASKRNEKTIARLQAKLAKAEKQAAEAEERVKQIQEMNVADESTKEATAELQARLEKAEAALGEANKAAQQSAEAEQKLRQQLNDAKKQSADNGGQKAVAQFELLFQQAVAAANQMRDIMLEIRQTDEATAEKLSGILVSLSDAVRRCAE